MDVGLELRHARERRGLSLQQLSNITKISPRVLQAIEACDEHRLPAPVYTRAFIKTYAAEVGLDPHDTARNYLEQFVEPAAAEERDPERVIEPGPAPAPFGGIPGHVLQGRFGTATVFVLVGLAIVALAAGQRSGNDGQQPAVATAGVVPAPAAEPAPVGTSGTTPPATALQIAIAPTGPCWVQAAEGDSRLFATLLSQGDRRTIDSSSDVTLRVGDPATCAFTINGKPARVPGAAGQAVTVHISTANYTQFLAR
jgi:cytoskeletal protein RodZ